jgi:very-short-patch-repair endonuclease
MNKLHNSKLSGISKTLRKNMTKEEKHLWYDFLKDLPQTIKRQKIIGTYIVDFYCAEAKIVIELDGSQHYSDEGKSNDKERDSYLNSLGITVLRYSNFDIQRNFDGVCIDIIQHITTSSESLRDPPSPQGEG